MTKIIRLAGVALACVSALACACTSGPSAPSRCRKSPAAPARPQWRWPWAHVVQPSVEVKRTVPVNMASEQRR